MKDETGTYVSRRRLLAWSAGATFGGLVQGACSSAGGTDGDTATGGGPNTPTTGGGGATVDGGGGQEAQGGARTAVDRDPEAVAVVRCTTYESTTVHARLKQALDSLGDLRGLVQGKVVGIKPNLTGDFQDVLGLSAGETYITHGSTALALTSLLFEAGARQVRFLESIPSTDSMTALLERAGWNVAGLFGLGNVHLENTRNLGSGTSYSRLSVPGGRLYTHFDVNAGYEEIDVLVSLAKMKNHALAGVTLSMKNLFGITPLSLYGSESSLGESALGYRGPTMHDGESLPPGEIAGFQDRGASYRIARIVVDEVAARPIDLAIVEGITSVRGGEGPWQEGLQAIAPGLLIAGWNPVATDAVATKIMGYDPLGVGGPFVGDNHVLLAHQAGLGNADTSRLDVRGLSVAEALFPFG